MSQSQGAPRAARREKPGRYQRSPGGLLAAMVVTVVLVAGYAGLRAFLSPEPTNPVQAVPWKVMLRAGVSDGKLAMLAPPSLPAGWKATSANYTTGTDAAWHLGLLTKDQKFVGLDESRSTIDDLVQQYVDADATRGKDVRLNGQTWQVWTDAGGDYGLATTVTGPAPGRDKESVLVAGSAPPAQVRALVQSLRVNGR